MQSSNVQDQGGSFIINTDLRICVQNGCTEQSRIIKNFTDHDRHQKQKHEILDPQELQDLVKKNQALQKLMGSPPFFETFKAGCDKLIKLFQDKVLALANSVQEQSIDQSQTISGIRELVKSIQQNDLDGLCKHQKWIMEIKNYGLKTSPFQNSQEQSEQTIENLTKSIHQLFSNNKFYYEENLLEQYAQTQGIKSLFSNTLKGQTILVRQDGLQVRQTKTSSLASDNIFSSYFSLIHPPLDKVEKRLFQVKILNCKAMGIGICRTKNIEKQEFNWDNKQGCHNSYTICSNGYFSVPNKPCIENYFFFETNDIILMHYDPKTKLIEFRNRTKRATYTIQIPETEIEDLSACVCLEYENEEAELVNV